MKIKTTGSTGLYLVESKDKAWKDLDLLMHLYTTVLHTTCWEGYASWKVSLGCYPTMDLLFFGQRFRKNYRCISQRLYPKVQKIGPTRWHEERL